MHASFFKFGVCATSKNDNVKCQQSSRRTTKARKRNREGEGVCSKLSPEGGEGETRPAFRPLNDALMMSAPADFHQMRTLFFKGFLY
jgi:hypothetical protein